MICQCWCGCFVAVLYKGRLEELHSAKYKYSHFPKENPELQKQKHLSNTFRRYLTMVRTKHIAIQEKCHTLFDYGNFPLWEFSYSLVEKGEKTSNTTSVKQKTRMLQLTVVQFPRTRLMRVAVPQLVDNLQCQTTGNKTYILMGKQSKSGVRT